MRQPQERQLSNSGNSLGVRAFHQVCITRGFGPERNKDLAVFAERHISEFKGNTEIKHDTPQMLFEREQDAQEFANELQTKLNIPKRHIRVKARANLVMGGFIRRASGAIGRTFEYGSPVRLYIMWQQ
jgi:hypothetical protein